MANGHLPWYRYCAQSNAKRMVFANWRAWKKSAESLQKPKTEEMYQNSVLKWRGKDQLASLPRLGNTAWLYSLITFYRVSPQFKWSAERTLPFHWKFCGSKCQRYNKGRKVVAYVFLFAIPLRDILLLDRSTWFGSNRFPQITQDKVRESTRHRT